MNCPEKCRINRLTRNFYLLSDPTYLCINLQWTGINPKLVDILKLFCMLPLRFNIEDLFKLSDK